MRIKSILETYGPMVLKLYILGIMISVLLGVLLGIYIYVDMIL